MSPSNAAGGRSQPERRPNAARQLADHRGLRLPGALLLAAGLTLLGASVDAETASPSDSTLRTLFTVCFALGGLAAILLVHRERTGSVVIALPILYGLAAALSGALYAQRNSETIVKEGGLDAVTSLVTHAPTLLAVTGIAALLAYLRRSAGRRPTTRRPTTRG